MKKYPTDVISDKPKLHINEFSQETQNFIHNLCANAIKRAINNGTYETNINKGSME